MRLQKRADIIWTGPKLRIHLYSCEREAKSFCVLLLVYFKAEARNKREKESSIKTLSGFFHQKKMSITEPFHHIAEKGPLSL